jgi:hypothetical protein
MAFWRGRGGAAKPQRLRPIATAVHDANPQIVDAK